MVWIPSSSVTSTATCSATTTKLELPLEFCTTFGLTQLINSPTRITESSQSLIDVIMTINKEIVTSSGVLASSISDQNLIYLLLNLKVPRAKPSYVSIM